MRPIAGTVVLSALLHQLRTDAGKSLQQIADVTGLSKQHVWALEQGATTNPSVSTLIALGACLGVSAHVLFAAAVRGYDEETSGSRVRIAPTDVATNVCPIATREARARRAARVALVADIRRAKVDG